MVEWTTVNQPTNPIKDKTWNLRWKAIQKLGGKCECCGESHPEFLQFDHRAGVGAGALDRRVTRSVRYASRVFFREIIGGEHSGLRLLCGSWHFAITRFVTCPHELEKDLGSTQGEGE